MSETLKQFKRRLHCAHVTTDEIIKELYFSRKSNKELSLILDEILEEVESLREDFHASLEFGDLTEDDLQVDRVLNFYKKVDEIVRNTNN